MVASINPISHHHFMLKERAPVGIDGKPINLHYMLQTKDSPLAELTETFHKKHSKFIHINPKSIKSTRVADNKAKNLLKYKAFIDFSSLRKS